MGRGHVDNYRLWENYVGTQLSLATAFLSALSHNFCHLLRVYHASSNKENQFQRHMVVMQPHCWRTICLYYTQETSLLNNIHGRPCDISEMHENTSLIYMSFWDVIMDVWSDNDSKCVTNTAVVTGLFSGRDLPHAGLSGEMSHCC